MTTRKRRTISILTGVLCASFYCGSVQARGNGQAKDGDAEAASGSLTDAEIIGVAETANASEVAQSELAEKKARNRTARSFAELMVAEHDDLERRTEALAKEIGAEQSPVSADLKRTGDTIRRKLSQAARTAFDRVYLQTQIDEYQKVLKAFDERLIPAAKSPKLKSLLGELRTDEAHHLQIAKATLTELEKAT